MVFVGLKLFKTDVDINLFSHQPKYKMSDLYVKDKLERIDNQIAFLKDHIAYGNPMDEERSIRKYNDLVKERDLLRSN